MLRQQDPGPMRLDILIFILIFINIFSVYGHDFKSSLTFVIDDTASMGDDIEQVKSKTNEVFEAVLVSNASMIDEFVLVTFNDPDAELRTITNDRDEFKRALASLHVHDGDDCPEMAMKGVEIALENSKPNSFFYIFTDASARDHERFEYVKNIGQKKSIQVTFLLTGLCGTTKDPDYQVYHELAAATSGQVFHMSKQDIGKILDYIIESIKSKKTPLGCKIFPSGYKNRLSFTVDSKISDVIVSVSGVLPTLLIFGPEGNNLKTKELVKIVASYVVKIITTPGVYTIEVGSRRDTSVLITGSTTVCFQHGFSAFQPRSIHETSTKPSAGGQNHLSIALTNVERDVKLDEVEIIDMNDNIIMKKTLQLLNENEQFYVTEPFDPPKVMFRIAIKGKINGIEPITRVGSTSIEFDPGLYDKEQIKNKPPKLYILSDPVINLNVNDKLILMCKVSGYPKPDIVWESDEGIDLISKVMQVDVPYDYLSILEIADVTKNIKYQCKATNVLGNDTASVEVTVKEKIFFNVIEVPKDLKINYKNNEDIKCQIDASPPVNVTWYKDKIKLTTNPNIDISADGSILSIKNMTPDLVGSYSCEASNTYEDNTFEFTLAMSELAPSVFIVDGSDIIVEFNSSQTLKCEVNGYPEPKIVWVDDSGTELAGMVSPANSAPNYISTLYIENVNLNTSYTCKATNIIGTDSRTVAVTVNENRFFNVVEVPKDITIDYQDNKDIICHVNASPPVLVTWYRNNVKLTTGINFDITNNDQILKINSMNSELVGNYSCQASNNYENNTFEFMVMMTEFAPTVNILGDTEINVKIDSPVTLICEVSGYPKPIIVWEDGSGVDLPGEYTPAVSTEKFLNTLKIANVTQNTTYTCKATNIIGSIEESVLVIAKENNFFNIIEYPKDESIVYHDSKEIKCIIDALPPATIIWYKGNQTVPTDSNFVTSSDGSILKIQNMEPEFEGSYSCEASNGYDNKTFNFEVNITGIVPSVVIIGDSEVHVQFDNSLILNCKVIGYPKPHVIWKDEFGTEVHSELSLVDTTDEYIISVLTIEKVNTNATYFCVATNTEGVDKKPVNVKTTENKYFIVIEAPKDEIIAYQGNKDITCKIDALPPASIIWFQDNLKISTDDDFDISSDSSILKIKSMKPKLVGNYSCDASSSYDSNSFKFEVMISGVVPTIEIVEGSDINVKYNDPLFLNCKVSGYPKPDIVWQNVNGIAEQSVLSLLDSTDDYAISVLTIAKVNENTTYYCVATNPEGTDKKPIHVKTVETIYFNVLEVPKGGTIAFKASKEIRCKIDALPSAKIFWYKNGKKIVQNNKLNISPDGSILKIKSMQPEFVGKYYCEVINKYERKTFDFDIKIIGAEKPKIDKKINEYKVQKGSNVDLVCSVIQGDPKPNVSWQFKHSALGKFETLGNTGENVKIYSTKATDIGTYRCKAHNEIGDDFHNLDLIVEYPPVVEIDEKELTFENGERVKLACRVDGFPVPDVQWYKNGIEITNGNKYRIFRDNTLSFTGAILDSGTYTCKATNIFDVAEKSIRVDFYIPVKIEPPLISSIELNVGGSSKLFCRADGYPKPDIKWTYYSYDIDAQPEVFVAYGDPGIIVFDRIQQDEEGFYTCTAKNIGGYQNITYSVIVTASPSIVNELGDKNLKAVDGDLLFKIPCKTLGGPKPTIIWKKNGLEIDSGTGEYDIEKSGTLIIKKPNAGSAASYTCQAKNILGNVSETFEVEVLPHPIAVEPMMTILLTEGETKDIECKLPHNQGDIIRWFKDNKFIKSGELRLENVMTSDKGVYSCRVSTHKSSHSFHVKISIGIKPTFMTNEDKYIDYSEGSLALLECGALGDPIPKIVWTRDGRKINVTSMTHMFLMEVQDIGTYKCNVSNAVGFIIRTFEIKTGECSLNIETDFFGNQPLLLSHTMRWPIFEKSNGAIKIPQFRFVTLHCPGTFFSNPGLEREEYVSATCVQDSTLHIKGKDINFSDIKCQKEIKPIFYATGMACGVGLTELIHVGFSLKSGFLGVFDVCVDKRNHISLFTRHSIDRTAAEVVSNIVPKYESTTYLTFDFEDFYQCSQQINVFASVLGKPFHVNDRCCFSKRQLVNPRNVLPGLPQVATYNYLNVMPQWSTCNTQNWDDIEQRVRSIVTSLDYKMIVWTGSTSIATVTDQRLYLKDKTNQQQAIPKFLWKVIQNMELQAAVAIVQVNIPDLTESQAKNEILCKDICDEIDWLKNGQWRDVNRGFTYCCDIVTFEHAFNYTLLFRGTWKVLKEIPNIARP